MDITFDVLDGVFNYRVSAVVLYENKLLVMRDEKSPYYYLPGGRVKMYETAQKALIREIREEIGVEPVVVRPLWLNQSFFNEDVKKKRFHELCLYYLVDLPMEIKKKDQFFTKENGNTLSFSWLDVGSLEQEYLYPNFIKKEILSLPDALKMIEEYE